MITLEYINDYLLEAAKEEPESNLRKGIKVAGAAYGGYAGAKAGTIIGGAINYGSKVNKKMSKLAVKGLNVKKEGIIKNIAKRAIGMKTNQQKFDSAAARKFNRLTSTTAVRVGKKLGRTGTKVGMVGGAIAGGLMAKRQFRDREK